jgi:hypothetical protein
MHCLTVSLAEGGAGLGTAFGEQTANALITDVHWLPAWNARIRRVLEPPSRPLAPGAEWVGRCR